MQAQESISVLELLKRIQALRIDTDHSIYPAGLFASQRYHPFLSYLREDDNIFFSLTVAYTLKEYLSDLGENERGEASSIIDGVVKALPFYRNKTSRPTYNFWQTNPSRHFPNGILMHRFEHFRIADDVDDTVLAHLTNEHTAQESSDLLHLIKQHSNGSVKRIKNTWPEYKNLKASSTFFGVKMRIEFDAVVLCNVLLWLSQQNALDNALARDSIAYIVDVVKTDRHITNPFKAAPNYPTTELILYHIARLISKTSIEALYKLKGKLVEQLTEINISKRPALNGVLVQNAMLMLHVGERSDGGKQDIQGVKQLLSSSYSISDLKEDQNGYFFHAGMLSAFENSVAQSLSGFSLFHFRYRCEALGLALLLENLLLRKRFM